MKNPIKSRELLYDKLRDKTLHLLDWCLVNTDCGTCLEPRSLPIDGGAVVLQDPFELSFNRFTEIDADQMATIFGSGGDLLPRDYVNRPA